jgi:hypothetical protein
MANVAAHQLREKDTLNIVVEEESYIRRGHTLAFFTLG